jgi:hypothetical protein
MFWEESHDFDSIKQDRSIIGEYKTTPPVSARQEPGPDDLPVANSTLNKESTESQTHNVSKSGPTITIPVRAMRSPLGVSAQPG